MTNNIKLTKEQEKENKRKEEEARKAEMESKTGTPEKVEPTPAENTNASEPTVDVEKTVEQILALEKVGCEIIRVACLDVEDAKAIKQIKEKIHIPIVSDIHFDYQIALAAIEAGVDKVRINPGNIGDEEKTRAVVEACKAKNIPIRIGINAGSLEKEFLDKYGKPCSDAMIESAKRHVEILEKLEFYDIAISLKASNLDMCIEEKNITENVYNVEKEATIILDLRKFNSQNKAIQKRVILYSINKIFGSTKGIEKIHIEDITKLCNNNIGNKFLTPNKKTKIVIKNKKIYIRRIKNECYKTDNCL